MPKTLIIYDGAGPLPQSVTFQSPVDGSATFILSGTARTGSAAILLGISLTLDGSVIGNPAMCWANQNDVHMVMRTTFIPVDYLKYGSHQIEITNANSATITDVNDYFQVVLLY